VTSFCLAIRRRQGALTTHTLCKAGHGGDKGGLAVAGGFAERWLDKWAWQWQTTGRKKREKNSERQKQKWWSAREGTWA